MCGLTPLAGAARLVIVMLVRAAIAVPAVHEEVHQRTGEKQRERQPLQRVRAVVQDEGECRARDEHAQRGRAPHTEVAISPMAPQ